MRLQIEFGSIVKKHKCARHEKEREKKNETKLFFPSSADDSPNNYRCFLCHVQLGLLLSVFT